MTDQSDTPAPQSGDPTVPLVPEFGYAQPEVPPLEETTWPDFSYDDPAGSSLFGAAEPTSPLPASPPAASPYAQPAPTTPLPYVDPQHGVAYQQPTPPTYQPQPSHQPQPSYQQPQPSYQSQPTYQSQPAYQTPRPPEPAMYETYQPYAPPAPVVYNYPLAVTSAPEHPSAVASLVLGIVGIFVLPILAPVAWIVAGRARREIARFPGRWASGGSLTAGYVLGIIGTLLWGAVVAFFMLIFVIAFSYGG